MRKISKSTPFIKKGGIDFGCKRVKYQVVILPRLIILLYELRYFFSLKPL